MGLKRIPAYAAIYLLWGGAYLAIRVLVLEFPPFLVAGLRYLLAAAFLVPFVFARRRPWPTLRQAFNAAVTGVLLLAVGYGVVFWAEKRLPSWLAAVLISTTFIWTFLAESFILRTIRLRLAQFVCLLLGLAGMPLLTSRVHSSARATILPMAVVLFGAVCWSAGTLAVKCLEMPRSPAHTAAIQLAASGAALLAFSAFLGEPAHSPPLAHWLAWQPLAAMTYLVVGSSMMGFFAFIWLLAREPASMVASSAYVNPIVAMVLGIFAAHERCSAIQLAGASAVLLSVVMIWVLQRPDCSAEPLSFRRVVEG